MKWLWLLAFGLIGSLAQAQEPIRKVSLPYEVRAEVNQANLPKELEGLVWNRWTSKNFVVCSLDDVQAEYLHKHLELVKGWIFARWGMYDVDFSAPCKLICVDKPALFEKLFRLQKTKVEVRRTTDGKIKETVIFMLIDGPPSRIVPIPLTTVCLLEFAQKYNTHFPVWSFQGMSILNGDLEHIRGRLTELKSALERNDGLYFSKSLLEMDLASYKKLEPAKMRVYDNCAMAFCLLVRKEFGQEEFLKSLQAGAEKKPEDILHLLKFKDFDQFDKTFKRFLMDLSNDVVAGKTPDHYLQIRERLH